MVIPLLVTIFFVGACASVPHKELDPKVFYKRSLRVRVNEGPKVYGVQVVNYSEKVKVETKSPNKGDVVILKTCHREHLSEDEGKRFKLEYTPAKNIEIGEYINCPLTISHMNTKGRHSWGMVFFRDKDLSNKLIAHLSCNGSKVTSVDKSVCQSKEGLEQEISFNMPVKFKGCKEFQILTADNKTFRFITPNRLKQCLFYTKEKTHLLIGVGYEQVLLREN